MQGGQLDVYVETREQHEVAQSIHAFNDMAVRLKQAEQQSQEQSKRTIEALERQRIAEIKTLENQINSHFLYNTLNSINYTAIRDGNLMVSRQIKHLAQVLRYTFERSDGQVTGCAGGGLAEGISDAAKTAFWPYVRFVHTGRPCGTGLAHAQADYSAICGKQHIARV